MRDDSPLVWILDSARKPLADLPALFEGWAEALYLEPDAAADWGNPPDALFVSGELAGGAAGEAFAALLREAGDIPLLAVSRLRSFTQALAFFRAGAVDYLSLPLDGDDLRERLGAALERAAELALRGALVEIEPLDQEPGEISLSVQSAVPARKPPAAAAGDADDADDEPVAVEGLPIPTLWEELPCGLVVFDSDGGVVFSNSLALELFGRSSPAELRTALEEGLSSFAAHAANRRPLPDNQWPHVLARKARAARSAVLSLERPDRRRAWLRIDCLPHLSGGKVSRLAMTVVNLTGELPPLSAAPAEKTEKKGKGKGGGRRGK